MRTGTGLLAALLSISSATAVQLAAQTLPVPSLPPPVEEPEDRPASWEYVLGAGISWDSNVEFLVPEGQSSGLVVPRGGITRRFSGPRGQLMASASAEWAGYLQKEIETRPYADIGSEGEIRLTTHTTLRGDVRYWVGYSDASPTLIEQGVPLPLLKTQSLNARLDLTQQLSGRSSLRIEGRFMRTDFDAEDAVDGSSQRATIAWERTLSERSTAGLAYAFERDAFPGGGGDAYSTHFGSLQWARLLSSRSAILLEVGASYTPDAQQAGLDRRESFFGGVTFRRQAGRASLTSYVRQEVTPAFGVGISRRETRGGLQADVPLGEYWTLSLGVYLTQPWAPSESNAVVYSSYSDGTAGIARRLGRWLVVSGEVRYRRRGETTSSPAVGSFQAGVFITLESRTR